MSQDNQPFTIHVKIDPYNAEHVLQAETLIRAIKSLAALEAPASHMSAMAGEFAAAEQQAPGRRQRATTKPAPVSEPEPATAPEPVAEPEHQPDPEPVQAEPAEASSVTREELRALVQAKATTGHRDAVKAKLTELGAANVSQLSEERFDDLNAFLLSLP